MIAHLLDFRICKKILEMNDKRKGSFGLIANNQSIANY